MSNPIMITLSVETVRVLLNIAGQRLVAEEGSPKFTPLTVAVGMGGLTEADRAHACDEAGRAYSEAYQQLNG